MIETLRRYFGLGVGKAGDSDSPGDDQPPDADAGTGDDTLDDLLDEVEPPKRQAADEEPESPKVKEARQRAEKAEADLAAERSARQRAEAAIPARPAIDSEYDREEAQLAEARKAGQDTSMLEWTIRSNRTIREAKRDSQSALAEARDIADKTAFDQLQTTKPQTYKRYAPRIEAALADMRAKGQPSLPRLAMLRFFIGDDAMNGTIKPKAAKATAATEGKTVDRGRTPGARTDVTHKGGLTEKQKRDERLRNTLI